MGEGYTGFIQDGYTREGVIHQSDEWRYPQLRFTWRPMTKPERARWQEKIRDAKNDFVAEQVAAEVIANRVTEWDLSHDGSTVPVTKDNVMRLEDHLSARLLNIVMGYAPDDSGDGSDAETEDADLGN